MVAATGALIVGTATPAAAAPGGYISLQPTVQSDTTGTQAAVEVVVDFQDGTPVDGGQVIFSVYGGPDTGQGFTGYTDSGGADTWYFTGYTAGTDLVSASWVNQTGTTDTASASVNWVAPPPPPPPPTPPTISTSGPTNATYYVYGQVPPLDYSCASTDGTGISYCGAYDEDGNYVPSGTQVGAGTGVEPGNYGVTITANDNNGLSTTYSIYYTVVPIPQYITYNSSPPSPAYYGGSYTVSATGGGSGNAVQLSLGTGAGSACSLSGSTVTFIGLGTCQIVANQAGDEDWDAAPTAYQSFTVVPAPLTITASSSTSIYGSPIAAVTPAYHGFVFGQGPSVLNPAASCSSAAVQSSNVGSYTNSCSGASDPDYAISYVNGTQTINPAPLTVTASSATILYGQAIPAITPSYQGFVLGQSASVLSPQPSCSTTANAASNVAVYPTSCSGAKDTNYTISYVGGSLTIKPAPTALAATPAIISVIPTNPYLFNLTTTLTSQVTGKGIPNQTVNFSTGGLALCTATTDANGTATCQVLCTAPGIVAALEAAGYGQGLSAATCELLLSLQGVLSTVLDNGYNVNYGGVLDYLPSSGAAELIDVLNSLLVL